MQVRQTGLSHARFLLAFILSFWPTVAASRQSNSAPQENGGTADLETIAKSATAAREAGHADVAIREYLRGVEIDPKWGEGWWYLGTLLYDADRYSEAIPAFQRLAELAPSAGPTWNFLGLCEFETKDYENSLAHLKKGLSLGDADDPETAGVAKYHLALLLNRSGESDQAANLLASAFGQNEVPAQIKIALGLAMLRVPLFPKEIDPSQDALIYAAGEAASAIAQRDSAKTLTAFTSLIVDYPDIPYVHYAYGKVLAFAGRNEDALKQQDKEVSISPKSALPWIEISQLQLRLQHPQEALHAAQEAVKRAPDSPASHKALEHIWDVLGEKEKAAEELAIAEKLEPEKYAPEERIALLYANHTGARSEGNGQVAARQPNDSGSESFEEISKHAATAQAAGDADQAIQNYQRALQLRPEWDDGRWNLAILYYSGRHYPEAISELKRWVERKPNFGPAWEVMGLCEFEMKDYKNALIHLLHGEQLGIGGSAEAVGLAKCRLAMLLNRGGQFDEAIGVLAGYVGQGTIDKEMRIALGMAQLRIPMLPAEMDPARKALVESVGDISVMLLGSKYDLAFPKLLQLLKEFPATPFLHYMYGTALMALSEYDEAEAQLREELRVSPRSELPYVALASIALKRQRPADAMAAAQRAVELAPDSADTHYLLGRACLDAEHEKQAVDELEAASKLAPGSPKVHFNLAKAYAKIKRPEKAEEERAIFARLNALAEEERSHTGSQAYGAAHGTMDVTPTPPEKNRVAPPLP